MWIPLDIILTFLIVLYQAFYRYLEILEETAAEEDTCGDSIETDDYINQNGKESLGPIEKFSMQNNDDGEIQLNMSLFTQSKAASAIKGGILAKMREASKKKKKKDSIFDFANEKKSWKLTKDASSMGYGVFLTKEFNGGLDFEDDQRAMVWMNTFIVQLLQVFLLAGCFYFASINKKFVIVPA